MLAAAVATVLVLWRPGRFTLPVLGAAAALTAVQTFGLVIGAVGAVAAGELHDPAGLLTQLYVALGTAVYAASATARSRRRRGRCPRCGTEHPPRPGVPLHRPAPTAAPRRTRTIAYVALLGIVPWAGFKLWLGWGGDAFGMTAEEWDEAAKDGSSTLSRLLDSIGIDITVLAAVLGIVVVLALTGSWAQRLRVPRWLLLVPAWGGAVSLTLYGYPLIAGGVLMRTGLLELPADPGLFSPGGLAWVVLFGGTTFAGLGTALALGARSYQHRTRPVCAPISGAAAECM